ncbi:MAG: CRTAC1 family protein, partial [Silvibacterium sp.]
MQSRERINAGTVPPSRSWTRRRVLGTASAACALPIFDRAARALSSSAGGQSLFARFTDIAQSAGLTETMVYGNPDKATYIFEVMGGGCAFFDYDNDGWMDIFILGGRQLDAIPHGASNRLYHNNRDGTFTDVTEKAGLIHAGWATGVCVGDYNNDGFEDLFVTYYGHNRLYRNNGDGTFTDVTTAAGLAETATRFGTGCTFVDYNRDGWLDLFVANYVEVNLARTPSLSTPNCNFEGVPVNCGPQGLPFPRHSLYRNNGNGTFTDVSKESGIAALTGSYGLTAVTFDVDEDGWPDILVACDSTPSLLLMNNHDGTFREEGLMRGLALSGDGQQVAGMGIGVGDYNLDGHLDVVRTHFMNQAAGLYQGEGHGAFEDVTSQAGLAGERRFISWGTAMMDLDNDGHPDLLWVTGTVYPELQATYPEKYPRRGPRLVFRNLGGGRFVELGPEAGSGITAAHVSRGCAFGDFDNDGDMDVLIMNQNEPPSLLRNDAPPSHNWLKVRLEGTKSNRSAIGSRVLVRYGGKIQAQTVMSQTSYLSANDPRLHFGLGAEKTAEIEVHWPL